MLKKSQNGIQWYEFEQLAELPFVRHAVFTRNSGTSTGAFQSLNISFSVGDEKESVEANLDAISQVMGTSFVRAKQVHGKNIKDVSSYCQPECDALATNQLNLGLMISHADCQAAIFYDPIMHAVANVHCGWRGNVQNIYKHTVLFMKDRYGSKPDDLLVCMSPSLGPEKAEFLNYQTELPKSFWDFQIKPNYFDLWEVSQWQLKECSVLPHHIEIAKICTYENEKEFYSYRREKTTGRNATCVVLEPLS